MPMQQNDDRAMTLRQLAEAILALPADQQEQRAGYSMIDDQGFETCEPVLEVQVQGGEAVLRGVDRYNVY